jgi:hypothetical protein
MGGPEAAPGSPERTKLERRGRALAQEWLRLKSAMTLLLHPSHAVPGS